MVRQMSVVPDEVRAVPAPPLPTYPEPYSARFADPDGDAEMLSEWMNRPHLVETWGYNYPADQWRRHLEVQFEGTFSRPHIVSLNGRPIVYVEYYRSAQDYIATLYDAHPHDLGFHAAIADPELLNQGVAQVLLPSGVKSVFKADPECRRVVGDTAADPRTPGNQVARRLGGVFLGQHYVPAIDRHLVLFTWPRTPDDIPAYRQDS